MHVMLHGVGANPHWYWVRGHFNQECLPTNTRLVDHWLAGCLSGPATDGLNRGLRNTEESPRDVSVIDSETRWSVREAFDHLFGREKGATLSIHLKGMNVITGVVGSISEGLVYVRQAGGVDSQIAYHRIDDVTKDGFPVENP